MTACLLSPYPRAAGSLQAGRAKFWVRSATKKKVRGGGAGLIGDSGRMLRLSAAQSLFRVLCCAVRWGFGLREKGVDNLLPGKQRARVRLESIDRKGRLLRHGKGRGQLSWDGRHAGRLRAERCVWAVLGVWGSLAHKLHYGCGALPD